MKKYKLIQTYPNSPALGTEIVKSFIFEDNRTIETYTICAKHKNFDGGVFRIPNPWLYKSNWERVIEIEFEVVTLSSNRSTVLTYNSDGECIKRSDNDSLSISVNLQEGLKRDLKITSIRRLSDNKIISVGTLVKYHGEICSINKIYYNEHEQLSFSVESEGIGPKTGVFYGEMYHFEIIDREYEVLCFRNKEPEGLRMFTKLLEDGTYSCNGESGASLVWCLSRYKIHSVKRLSDGEIFTVGDKVDSDVGGFIITKLSIIGNTICVNGDGCQSSLLYLRVYQKPLFTTFDNVHIFKGDSCYPVTEDLVIKGIYNDVRSDGRVHNRKYFSTKQAAQEYIDSKKVLFTTEDGVDIKNGQKAYYLHKGFYTVCEAITPTGHESYLWFSTKEVAEKYVLMNEPKLSINDIKDVSVNTENPFGLIGLIEDDLIKKVKERQNGN